VKNYGAIKWKSRRESLISKTVKQAIDRAKQLPPGTVQKIIIDLRGQANIQEEWLREIIVGIVTESKGVIQAENIFFIK
jgi:hypothetical protein